jgi:hypothetical protein
MFSGFGGIGTLPESLAFRFGEDLRALISGGSIGVVLTLSSELMWPAAVLLLLVVVGT